MTRDTDPTPPHGIPRPALTALEAARAYLVDEMQNAHTLYSAEQLPAVLAPMQTLADLVDIAEVFPALWRNGEADVLESIVHDLAVMDGEWSCADCWVSLDEFACPTCTKTDRLCINCCGCDEEDEPEQEPARCDGCHRVPAFPTADDRYTLCLRCADQLADERSRPAFPYREGEGLTLSGWERVKDAPAHPFGGAADR
jgi:hypothetical protein